MIDGFEPSMQTDHKGPWGYVAHKGSSTNVKHVPTCVRWNKKVLDCLDRFHER